MRFSLECILTQPLVSVEYRKGIISYLKNAFQSYDLNLYNSLFNTGKPVSKPYAYSVSIPIASIDQGIIALKTPKLRMVFSTSDLEMGILAYNSLSLQKNKPYPFFENNTITLKHIGIVKEPNQYPQTCIAQFLSPLVVREHNRENNFDQYVLVEHQEFEIRAKKVLEDQLDHHAPELKQGMQQFSIKPVKTQKTVIKHYETYIEANRGTFMLSGPAELIRYFHQNGVGSRRGAGFGLFDIVRGGE